MIRSSFLSELCRISDMPNRHSHADACVFMYRIEGDAVLGERHHEVEVIINPPASCTITLEANTRCRAWVASSSFCRPADLHGRYGDFHSAGYHKLRFALQIKLG